MFSSKNFTPSSTGSSVSKVITPGTHLCKIQDITLDAPAYNPNAYFVNLFLIQKVEDSSFVGIAIDKNDPSKGNYQGPVANVKSGQYPFSDYVYNDTPVARDVQIFRFVNNLAISLGVFDKIQEANVEAETIEEYVTKVKPFLTNNVWGIFTIAGKEYFTEGYDKPNYRLFLPKGSGKKFPFAKPERNPEGKIVPATDMIVFDAATHIVASKEAKPKEVDGFSGKEEKSVSKPSDDFELPF